MSNIEQLTNEDLNLLTDFIVKPGGPADIATQRAIDKFIKEGIKSLVTVGVAGDTQAFLYVYQRLVDSVADGLDKTFVPASTEAH